MSLLEEKNPGMSANESVGILPVFRLTSAEILRSLAVRLNPDHS